MTEQQQSETFLTTTQAGKRLGYSDEKVRQLCEEGSFPGAFRKGLGGHWRIPESEVNALRERMRPKVTRRKPVA